MESSWIQIKRILGAVLTVFSQNMLETICTVHCKVFDFKVLDDILLDTGFSNVRMKQRSFQQGLNHVCMNASIEDTFYQVGFLHNTSIS